MSYATEGNRNTATRMLTAESDFISGLMDAANISQADAEKVLAVYRKARVVKMDAVIGVMTVKHGGFWDRDVILRALATA